MDQNKTIAVHNKTSVVASYECEYYHPVYDENIIAASSTKTLEVNGEEVCTVVNISQRAVTTYVCSNTFFYPLKK